MFSFQKKKLKILEITNKIIFPFILLWKKVKEKITFLESQVYVQCIKYVYIGMQPPPASYV